jgi:hypothetical protein
MSMMFMFSMDMLALLMGKGLSSGTAKALIYSFS